MDFDVSKVHPRLPVSPSPILAFLMKGRTPEIDVGSIAITPPNNRGEAQQQRHGRGEGEEAVSHRAPSYPKTGGAAEVGPPGEKGRSSKQGERKPETTLEPLPRPKRGAS